MTELIRSGVIAIAAADERRFYELAPLLTLPEVDLSISVKSHFVRNRHLHRLITGVARSPLTLLAYVTSLVITCIVFYVPSEVGRTLSIVVQVIGLPGALVSIGNLRYELVIVMLKTYDAWFICAVLTIGTLVLGVLLGDTRAVLMFSAWTSYVTNICIDASVLGVRPTWIANIISVACYTVIMVAVSTDVSPDLKPFSVVHINGHKLPAIAVVRDCLLTIIIVMVRNVVRKYSTAINEQKGESASTLFRCVSFRCRLQLRGVADEPDLDSRRTIRRSAHVSNTRTATAASNTKLRFVPDFFNSIDVRNTLLPMAWLWCLPNDQKSGVCRLLPWLGVLGFAITNTIYLVNVAWSDQSHQRIQLPLIAVGAITSIAFVAITLAAMQRQLLLAVVTSFDFVFMAAEIIVLHFALADILNWRTITVIALCADLQWCLWMLCWDAITPPVRKRLGLSRRFAAWVGPSLVGVLALVAVIIFFVKPADAINDRILAQLKVFGHTLEIRVLPWYFSCAGTIGSWSVRVMWRLWMASETELVVLDGTVVFENQVPSRSETGTLGQQNQVHVATGSASSILARSPLVIVPAG